MRNKVILILIIIFACTSYASAEIYRYVDEKGQVWYTNTPPTNPNVKPEVVEDKSIQPYADPEAYQPPVKKKPSPSVNKNTSASKNKPGKSNASGVSRSSKKSSSADKKSSSDKSSSKKSSAAKSKKKGS